jgi:hypothetical protein
MKIRILYILGIAVVVFIVGLWIASLDRKTKEPTYMGHPITEWLHNATADSTNRLTLDQMLTLKPVITGEEPSIATFELPISYDSLKKIGLAFLLVDANKNEGVVAGSGTYQECDRATNGNCLLEWNITYEPPGTHRLQVELFIQGQHSKSDYQKFYGPILPFYSSNVCQFFDDEFDTRGAILHAKVFETNTAYSIELRTPARQLIKTIVGKTTNGEIEEFWDLTDDKGNIVTNINEVDAVFYIKNTVSGISILRLSRLP